MRIHYVDLFEEEPDSWLVAFFRLRGYGESRSRREARRSLATQGR